MSLQGEPSQQLVYAIVPRTAGEDQDFVRLLPDGPPTWSHLRAVAANFSYWTVDRCGGSGCGTPSVSMMGPTAVSTVEADMTANDGWLTSAL